MTDKLLIKRTARQQKIRKKSESGTFKHLKDLDLKTNASS